METASASTDRMGKESMVCVCVWICKEILNYKKRNMHQQSVYNILNLFFSHPDLSRHSSISSYLGFLVVFFLLRAAAAKSPQSCLTLCDPIDSSPPGFPVPGILQARTLEWGAISFSNTWKWKVKVKSLNRVRLCATPWTAAYQAPPSMGFSRQEYWSGVPLPSPS